VKEAILFSALRRWNITGRRLDHVVRRDFKKRGVGFFSFDAATRDFAFALAFEISSDFQHRYGQLVGYPKFSYIRRFTVPFAIVFCSQDCSSVPMRLNAFNFL
jgi:hypothetical protein